EAQAEQDEAPPAETTDAVTRQPGAPATGRRPVAGAPGWCHQNSDFFFLSCGQPEHAPRSACSDANGCTAAGQPLMNKIKAIFSIPELRQKIRITLLFLAIYRIGYYIPLPFINQQEMLNAMRSSAQTALGQIMGFVSMLGGGNLSTGCIFALGIMPYISASIIFQL